MNRIDLEGRHAVVTGGGRGIGLAVAARFASSGARVALWDVDAAELDRVRARHPEFRTYVVDVTDEARVRDAMRATVRDLGRIDVFVNGAGIAGARVKVVDCDYADWRRVLDVNLNGTFLCCREVLKHMQATGYGRIVNVASIAGKEGNAYSAHYSAAKAGVISLTKSLAKEAIEDDIRINAIAPAAVQTDLFAAMPVERQKAAVSRIPMGRAGRVEEVAAMIAWMASEECSFTTGFAFDLSGGRATY
ncbi:MAG TPA: SDR family NAD(P)-dependent oxidoreductase [Casimicrobiaceae bacterium]|nr:SDR family NAD(P)-dependent oxidoreductase [Casimicrobiaceae bacterium]